MHDSQTVLRDLLREWRLKTALIIFLLAIYWTGYFFIERHLWRNPIDLKLLPLDRWTGFSPGWVWGYQSIYLLLPLPYLATTRDDMRRYGIGFMLMTLAAFACFIFLPVRGPRPPFTPTSGMYGLVTRFDLPFNNLPSLHMAVAAYSACVAVQVTSGHVRRVLMTALPGWIVLIGYSALATKQHYAVDLPPGVLLGFIAQRAAWFSKPTRQPTPT